MIGSNAVRLSTHQTAPAYLSASRAETRPGVDYAAPVSDLIPWLMPWSGRFLVGVCVAAGVVFAAWGLLRRRYRRGSCARCGYALAGLGGRPCPECGCEPETRAARPRPGRGRWVAVGLMVALALPAFVAQRRMRRHGWDYYLRLKPMYTLWPRKVVRRQRFGTVVLTTTMDRRAEGLFGPDRVVARSGGRTIATVDEGYRAEAFPAFVDPYGDKPNAPGVDLTGDGVGEVTMRAHSGGAHCCSTYVLIDPSVTPARVLLELGPSNAHPNAVDFDADGVPEIEYLDDTFAYWNTCFACSPMPRVLFAYDREAKIFRLSPAHMRGPVPDDLQAKAADLRTRLADATGYDRALDANPDLWGVMLDLIYTGHAGEAARFLRSAWPEALPGRDAFEAEFIEQLRSSPFAEGLEALNGGVLWPEAEHAQP